MVDLYPERYNLQFYMQVLQEPEKFFSKFFFFLFILS
jgi:hypothetical protein